MPGWLLIVPRRPVVSLRGLTPAERDELYQLHCLIRERQKAFGGQTFAFEHGSAELGSAAGCGVDQAHLHLVPLDFDLVHLATSATDGIDWTMLPNAPLMSLPSHGEYIAVWEVGRNDGAIGRVQAQTSQWMRRLIAIELGVEEEWNYRTNPHLANIQKTVELMTTK